MVGPSFVNVPFRVSLFSKEKRLEEGRGVTSPHVFLRKSPYLGPGS